MCSNDIYTLIRDDYIGGSEPNVNSIYLMNIHIYI